MNNSIGLLKAEVLSELEKDILPFWLDRMQDPAGGFYGQMDGCGRLIPDAPRGGILCARILWTFSSAYRILGKAEYLSAARNAFVQIRDKFLDRQFGGIYWSLNADGSPLDTKKQFYAIAFAVYGCAEFFRATGEEEALEMAISLWRSIEDHSLDVEKGGYIEACTRDWQPIEDMRLSAKDRNDAKTMNTHLHILEGYTGLYRVWKDETLRRRLVELCDIFMDRIVRPDGHLGLFFDEDWRSQSDMVSFGHDIEASWLLCETAELLDDAVLLARVRDCCSRIANAALEGLQPDGSMIYEGTPAASFDTDRHWWVQAETVVGCLNQSQKPSGGWLNKAIRCWDYIKNHLIAPDGEWYWSADAEGIPNTRDDRAGFWKCPYHNGRMCMEVLEKY
ncbi:MAG: AGE family epimerase/isomerase [Bacteroidales bacterium]|nr:AGE family epimerase/isomerase [Bacteroidales bacterium]